jgi:hypothetical protein
MNFGSRFSPVSFFSVVPPFPATAADNGLSVNAVSGRIVLGNDLNDAAAPAQLLSEREILTSTLVTGPFGLTFNDLALGVVTRLDGSNIAQNGGAGTNMLISQFAGINSSVGLSLQAGAGSVISLSESLGGNDTYLQRLSAGAITSSTNLFAAVVYDNVNTTTANRQLGSPIVAFNGAKIQVNGPLTSTSLVSSIGAAGRAIDRDIDSAKYFINSAATILTTPNMVAANFRSGFNFHASCNNAAGITVQLAAGQTARFGALATTAGGTLSSVTVGSTLRLYLINSTTWMTDYFTGTWVLT